MKRDTLFRLILALAVAAAVFVIGFFMRPDLFGREDTSAYGIIGIRPGGEPFPQIGGQIIYIEGGVEYRTDSGLWQRAEEGTDLEEGYAVETFGDGRAIIALDDGSVLRMNADSQIQLTSTDPHSMSIALIGGEVYSRVARAERTFEVIADDVTYESLGTAYTTTNEDDEQGVKVFHSKVKVKDAEGNELAVVDEGKKYYRKKTVEPEAEGKVTDLKDEEDKDVDFIKWNANEDGKYFEKEMGVLVATGEIKTDENHEQLSGVVESIKLTYVRSGKVTWSVTGIAPEGFKLVWSKSGLPTYPTRDGDKYKYYSDSDTQSGSIYASDGAGTYYIRVCEYLGDVCGTYSNEVSATFLEADEYDKETKTEQETASTDSSVTSIALSGNGSSVSWSVDGYSSQGFKMVWSKSSGPTYPTRSGDKFEYYSSAKTRSGSVYAFDGAGTYHVRVCEYLGGKCGAYSNEVTVDLATKETDYGSAKAVPQGSVTSIALSASGEAGVSWVTDGYSSKGYKIVWSRNSGPTYPTRNGDKYKYKSDPDTAHVELYGFDGSGTYYVRVCEYLGGACGVYSNEIVVEL